MSRFARFIRIAFAAGVLFARSYPCLAQNPADAASVVLTRLSEPVYPEIALTARVQGDVELLLKVRKDGSVESATVIGGPPLLMRAALSSAEHSQFECLNCVEAVTPYHVVYTYQIDVPPISCTAPDDCGYSSPRHPTDVSQSTNHITLTGHPSQTCICDYVKRVRSLKCLCLWKCGVRWFVGESIQVHVQLANRKLGGDGLSDFPVSRPLAPNQSMI